MKWLRSYFSINPFPFFVLGFGVVTLIYGPVAWPGKADFDRLVSLILIFGAIVFLAWRWDQDQPKSN